MIPSLASKVFRLFIYVFFLVLIPAGVVGAWIFLSALMPLVEAWVLLAIIQVVVSLIVVSLFAATREDTITSAEFEVELSRAAQRFSELYEQSPVPYFTIDRSGTITTFNLAAVRLMAASVDTLGGQDLFAQMKFKDEQEWSVFKGKLDRGVSINDEEYILKAFDGSEKWVRTSIFVHGARQERLVAMLDITHQKTVDQAKSEFVALAAHQLRTPIAAIRWNVELLQTLAEGKQDTEQLKYYEKISRNVTRMINLINDFLSVSKLETGTFATEAENLELKSFFESVIDENMPKVAEKSIDLRQHYEPEGLSLKADPRLLHIVINNLLSNAAKYTPEKGTVDIGYRLVGSQLEITVTDTGIGIPASEQPRLFTKFYRASNAQTHQTEGTGLGLYVVKQSVEKLGGTIKMNSEENVGTTFVVTLPYHT